jgi:hypothetical protein
MAAQRLDRAAVGMLLLAGVMVMRVQSAGYYRMRLQLGQ